MRNNLIILLFLCLALPTLAQSPDSTGTGGNSLGIIASPSLDKFFRKNNSLPVGLIYKRQTFTNKAWRFTIAGSYQKQNDPDTKTGPKPVSQSLSSLYLKTMAGFEWQKPLNKHFVFYYGADAGLSINKDVLNSEGYSYSQDDQGNQTIGQSTNYSNSRSVAYILKPMVGFQFKIHPKLYVATESSMFLSHSRFTGYSYSSYISNSDTNQGVVVTGGFKSNISRVWYQPLSNIQLVYQF